MSGREAPGLWVLEKNWRDKIAVTSAGNLNTDECDKSQMHDFVTGVLGSGQVELVLS